MAYIEITVRTNNSGEGYKMARWLNKQFIPNAITVIIESQLSLEEKR
jgi:hypothetical protein